MSLSAAARRRLYVASVKTTLLSLNRPSDAVCLSKTKSKNKIETKGPRYHGSLTF